MHRRAALDLNDTETKMIVRTPRDQPESFIPWIARLQYPLHRRQRRGGRLSPAGGAMISGFAAAQIEVARRERGRWKRYTPRSLQSGG